MRASLIGQSSYIMQRRDPNTLTRWALSRKYAWKSMTFLIVRPHFFTLHQSKINAIKLQFLHGDFTHRLEWLYHAATRSNHAYTLSTKSEVRQKHDILTFNFQSNAKFDAKNNFFSMRLSPTVEPWEPRGSTITGYPATSALVRTHP